MKPFNEMRPFKDLNLEERRRLAQILFNVYMFEENEAFKINEQVIEDLQNDKQEQEMLKEQLAIRHMMNEYQGHLDVLARFMVEVIAKELFFLEPNDLISLHAQAQQVPQVPVSAKEGQKVEPESPTSEDQPLRKATLQEVETALLAYKEEVLSQGLGHYRVFDGSKDAKQVQVALNLQGLDASTTAIIDTALRLNLC